MLERGTDITELKMIPSGGGAFEVTVNDKLIWSKKQTKTFPEDKQILDALPR